MQVPALQVMSLLPTLYHFFTGVPVVSLTHNWYHVAPLISPQRYDGKLPAPELPGLISEGLVRLLDAVTAVYCASIYCHAPKPDVLRYQRRAWIVEPSVGKPVAVKVVTAPRLPLLAMLPDPGVEPRYSQDSATCVQLKVWLLPVNMEPTVGAVKLGIALAAV